MFLILPNHKANSIHGSEIFDLKLQIEISKSPNAELKRIIDTYLLFGCILMSWGPSPSQDWVLKSNEHKPPELVFAGSKPVGPVF
jgi:hypothetical protein